MAITQYFRKFFRFTTSSGQLLMIGLLVSLFIANSPWGENYQALLSFPLGPYSLLQWINDGLMSVFFLLVGLEIKRELLEGELSTFKSASLPLFAAVGGMLVPALLYTFFNYNTPYQNGWGIPMATDIAFSLAVISLLGKKIPASLKIFLTALAIVDDLGAILVIALFYTEKIEILYLLLSLGILLFLGVLNYFKVKKLYFYLLPGLFLWYCIHHSGIHATIAGVLLAFMIPTNESTTVKSPLETLEEKLHMPVSYLIIPLFAIANTNIRVHEDMFQGLFSPLGMGIIVGLVLGKTLGISLFSFLAVVLKISKLPPKTNGYQMVGVALLAGIGFTMSIFMALLSFPLQEEIQDTAKLAILLASLTAGSLGFFLLKIQSTKNKS